MICHATVGLDEDNTGFACGAESGMGGIDDIDCPKCSELVEWWRREDGELTIIRPRVGAPFIYAAVGQRKRYTAYTEKQFEEMVAFMNFRRKLWNAFFFMVGSIFGAFAMRLMELFDR